MPEFYPAGKKISVAGTDFEIMPFVLRTRTRVLKIIVEILTGISKTAPDMKPSDIASNIPAMIEAAGERLVEIYEIVLKKDREWLLENVTLKDEVAIIQTIMEVNDIPFLVSQVKGLMKKKA